MEFGGIMTYGIQHGIGLGLAFGGVSFGDGICNESTRV
jgi:hypothetical protein